MATRPCSSRTRTATSPSPSPLRRPRSSPASRASSEAPRCCQRRRSACTTATSARKPRRGPMAGARNPCPPVASLTTSSSPRGPRRSNGCDLEGRCGKAPSEAGPTPLSACRRGPQPLVALLRQASLPDRGVARSRARCKHGSDLAGMAAPHPRDAQSHLVFQSTIQVQHFWCAVP